MGGGWDGDGMGVCASKGVLQVFSFCVCVCVFTSRPVCVRVLTHAGARSFI